MKRFVALFLALIMLFSFTAFAAESRAAQIIPSLTFTGTTANCSLLVSDLGSEIDVTMTLYYGSRVVGRWSGSGEDYLWMEEDCSVVSGRRYTLTITGTIDDVSFSPVSVSGTC